MRRLLLTTTALLFAGTAFAEDRALLLGNDRYETLGRQRGAAEVMAAADEFRDLGFTTEALRNGEAAMATEALEALADAEPGDRMVVALSGRFMTDGERSWYLLSGAEEPSLFNLAGAVSVESVLRVLGDRPGRAMLLLGTDPAADEEMDDYLSEGIGPLEVPQGVTVVRGAPGPVAGFLEDDVARPGTDLAAAIGDDRRLEAEGYLPRGLQFLPGDFEAPDDDETDRRDEELWSAAQRVDTLDGYQDYLATFPQGRHADAAEARVEGILDTPARRAEQAEAELELSRDARQEIQRDLTLLDYDTRGIDGIFGPGTRSGIGSWQEANDLAATTFLTRDQIDRLDAQAARRQAELEAEAEERRQAEARRDRTYWEETGARGDEAGYRAYLDRFPDGIHAEEARANLEAIEEEKRGLAEAVDRRAWDEARETNQVAAYRTYLDEQPQGRFREEAQARIRALQQQQEQSRENEVARSQEQQLGLNPLTARLVEGRLQDLGLEPGRVDGSFDEATRRALRRYQGERDLPATGFLNESTVVRLLADSVGQILQ